VLGSVKSWADIKAHWEAFAQVLLNNKKAQNLNMIENTLKTGLSIEEKEKLYRKIGLVDSAVVDEVSSFLSPDSSSSQRLSPEWPFPSHLC
jgi:hypothetical protein